MSHSVRMVPPKPHEPGCLVIGGIWVATLAVNVAWLAAVIWAAVWMLRYLGVLS